MYLNFRVIGGKMGKNLIRISRKYSGYGSDTLGRERGVMGGTNHSWTGQCFVWYIRLVTTTTKSHLHQNRSVKGPKDWIVWYIRLVTATTKSNLHHNRSVKGSEDWIVWYIRLVTTTTKSHLHQIRSVKGSKDWIVWYIRLVTTTTKSHLHQNRSVKCSKDLYWQLCSKLLIALLLQRLDFQIFLHSLCFFLIVFSSFPYNKSWDASSFHNEHNIPNYCYLLRTFRMSK